MTKILRFMMEQNFRITQEQNPGITVEGSLEIIKKEMNKYCLIIVPFSESLQKINGKIEFEKVDYDVGRKYYKHMPKIDFDVINNLEKFVEYVTKNHKIHCYNFFINMVQTQIIIQSKKINSNINFGCNACELLRIIYKCVESYYDAKPSCPPIERMVDKTLMALNYADIDTLAFILVNSYRYLKYSRKDIIENAEKNDDPEVLKFVKILLKNVKDEIIVFSLLNFNMETSTNFSLAKSNPKAMEPYEIKICSNYVSYLHKQYYNFIFNKYIHTYNSKDQNKNSYFDVIPRDITNEILKTISPINVKF